MKQSWPQRERARELLSKEVGYVRKPHGGRLRVALAFPNTYFVGMSNLGFQTVYTLFNAEADIVCERVFLPARSEVDALRASGAALLSLESQTPVREFDIFALSVSFEWDYTNVLTLLRLAGIPIRAADRTDRDDWRSRHVRESGTARALCRHHRGRRRRSPHPATRAGLSRSHRSQ